MFRDDTGSAQAWVQQINSTFTPIYMQNESKEAMDDSTVYTGAVDAGISKNFFNTESVNFVSFQVR